jgi:hypothetical protein
MLMGAVSHIHADGASRDGEFDVTVEKMLQKYLQKQTKWVHQLDYATSGNAPCCGHR